MLRSVTVSVFKEKPKCFIMASWQVRLGTLKEEIQVFLEEHPEFPIREPAELTKFATRKFMLEISDEEYIENVESYQMKKLEEKLKDADL
jgi:hypothetical protein